MWYEDLQKQFPKHKVFQMKLYFEKSTVQHFAVILATITLMALRQKNINLERGINEGGLKPYNKIPLNFQGADYLLLQNY